jgi:hypothetical protein
VILLITLVMLSSLAVGIPAILIVRDRLSRHAWDLAMQGSQTGQALLSARQSELENLARLTAQRPTLASLVELDNREELAVYLETFREGAGLDLVMLCDPQGKLLVQVGKPIPEQACQVASANQIFPSRPGANPPGWMLSVQDISLADNPGGRVFVGQAIDADFLDQLKQKTGMEHLFLYDGKFLSGSIPYSEIEWQTMDSKGAEQTKPPESPQVNQAFTLHNALYYAIRARFGGTPLETIVALSVSDIVEAQQRLTMWMVGGLLLGSILF